MRQALQYNNNRTGSDVVVWYRPIILIAFLLSVIGCEPSEPRGEIWGKVTFQGNPVNEGLITFQNKRQGIFMSAQIDADGQYTVTTADGAGLPPGTYRVCVTPPLPEPIIGPNFKAPKQKPYPNIPNRYRNASTSDISLEVKIGDNPFDVDMKP